MTSQESQEKPGGNTKKPLASSSSSVPKNQLYNWFFTLQANDVPLKDLHEILKDRCKNFTFSLEKGETGYLHYQGTFSLKTKEYFGTVKNLFPNKIHLEPTKDVFAAKNYCQKPETHVSGPWNEKSIMLNCRDPSTFYPWQKEVLELCNTEPDDRTVNWYWREEGGSGKSSLCRYLMINRTDVNFFNTTGMKDVAYALKDNCKIIIFDIPRDQEDCFRYGTIEALKNGMIFSGKYESCAKIINPPHVFVFCNFHPNTDKISAYKWNIIEVPKGIDNPKLKDRNPKDLEIE